jgi:hypothetical protein
MLGASELPLSCDEVVLSCDGVLPKCEIFFFRASSSAFRLSCCFLYSSSLFFFQFGELPIAVDPTADPDCMGGNPVRGARILPTGTDACFLLFDNALARRSSSRFVCSSLERFMIDFRLEKVPEVLIGRYIF